MSLEQFFNMGGYALYVWTSYGLTLAVLIINLILPWLKKNELQKGLIRLHQKERL